MPKICRIAFGKQKEGLIYETICVFLVIAMLLCTTSVIAEETTGKGQKTWEGETVEHKGFKDLGNYSQRGEVGRTRFDGCIRPGSRQGPSRFLRLDCRKPA